MSRACLYPHPMLTSSIITNVFDKVKDYLDEFPMDDKQELKLIVYGDLEPLSQQMWDTIFRDDLPNVSYEYSIILPPIPIPAHCTLARYEQYEKELRKYVARYVASKNLFWGLYNLAVPTQLPRMHLLLANRRVKRSELGRWAQTDESTRQRSLISPREFREQSILRLALHAQGSGPYNYFTSSEACLREINPPDEGESNGMVSSSVQSSQVGLCRDLIPTNGGVISGHIEGSSNGSSAEDRSSGRSSPSLADQDARFISIESLRGLVLNSLYFDPGLGIPEVSSSTTPPVEALDLSRSSAPGAGTSRR